MALIRCPDCGSAISSEALFCIHCGAPILVKKIVLLEAAREIEKKKIRQQKIESLKKTFSFDNITDEIIDAAGGCFVVAIILVLALAVFMGIVKALE
ncbi:MAG: zinc ribbon domain-containing protein [Deltaproteobacteria bacterium]|jgi:uncharacterized membrane protein YvbJ|nr:zinc ribbon domain-containing protein [Deltaproteobacteria bacterium]